MAAACTATSHTPSSSQHSESANPIVHYRGQRIDLRPFLEGYPFAPVLPLWGSNELLFDHLGDQKTLMRIGMSSSDLDLSKGTPLSPIDFYTRSRWDPQHHAASDSVLFLGDEQNDEVINLYRMALTDGSLTRLTNEPYVYGYSIHPKTGRIALLARRGEGPFTTCVVSMEIDGSKPTEHLCDSPRATFTWSTPAWAPDGSGVVTRVNLDGKRSQGNLAWVDFKHRELVLLTDPFQERTTAQPISPWLGPQQWLYTSDETGRDAIGFYDQSTGSRRLIFTPDADIAKAQLFFPEGTPRLVVTTHSPLGDALHLVDPQTGQSLDTHPLTGSVSHLDHDQVSRGLFVMTSAQSPFSAYRFSVTSERIAVTPWLNLPETLKQTLIQCDVKRVQFPTFDRNEAGEERMLHAYLYTPSDLPKDSNPLVRMLAFYGGENDFSTDNQIFCQAGIVTFSPSVRGSTGFGTDFYRLNDGDLGGNEIVDLFAGARWLMTQGYLSDRIGVYGRSHGGYATMRALTFPPGTNGHNDVFPFAFGMADAGFSDIISFHDQCNIPDWVLLEAGDPATEREKLMDRSPLHHVDKLNAPLFLSHGENDQRVPVSGSRQMAEACTQAGQNCTYLEFPGQGHRVRGLTNEQALYQARLAFLANVAAELSPAP